MLLKNIAYWFLPLWWKIIISNPNNTYSRVLSFRHIITFVECSIVSNEIKVAFNIDTLMIFWHINFQSWSYNSLHIDAQDDQNKNILSWYDWVVWDITPLRFVDTSLSPVKSPYSQKAITAVLVNDRIGHNQQNLNAAYRKSAVQVIT